MRPFNPIIAFDRINRLKFIHIWSCTYLSYVNRTQYQANKMISKSLACTEFCLLIVSRNTSRNFISIIFTRNNSWQLFDLTHLYAIKIFKIYREICCSVKEKRIYFCSRKWKLCTKKCISYGLHCERDLDINDTSPLMRLYIMGTKLALYCQWYAEY